MIDLKLDGRHPPDTSQHPPSVLKPRSPRPGLILFGKIASEIGQHPSGAIAGADIGTMIEPPAKSGAIGLRWAPTPSPGASTSRNEYRLLFGVSRDLGGD